MNARWAEWNAEDAKSAPILQQSAAATKQVESAMVSLLARLDVAGDNTKKVESAIASADLAFAKLAATTKGQATQAMDDFSQQINAAKDHLDTLPPAANQSTFSMLQLVGAVIGIQVGLGLAKEAFDFTKDAILSYNHALTEIATILPGQISLQGQMRDVLLSIPPVYGDLKTEGTALFTILSA